MPSPIVSWFSPRDYATARLRLGMGGVGTAVVASAACLAVDLPGQVFHSVGSAARSDLLTNASLLAVWIAGAALVCLPFEVLGGFVLQGRFGRKRPDGFGDWLLAWLRGVLIVSLVMSFSGALVLWAARYGGRVGGIGMLGLVLIGLVAFQLLMAQLVSGLRARRTGLEAVDDELRQLGVLPPRVRVVDAGDEGFTGGISGMPTAETIVLPVAWLGRFEPAVVALLVARRTCIVDRGLRALGLALAMGFTLFGFGIATALPGGGVGSVAEFISASLWFTLISFGGLLVLPTPSRAASFAGDALVLDGRPEARETLEATLGALDVLQSDEPERSDEVERIFHPIPNVAARLRALDDPRTEIAPWHVARTALFLSIAAMNPLHRLVHCNVGRPDLWVFLPADG